MTLRPITSPRRWHQARIWRAGAVATIALLAVAGCSSDDHNASSASSTAVAAASTAPGQARPSATDTTAPGGPGTTSAAPTKATTPTTKATKATKPKTPPTTGDITQTVPVAVQKTLAAVPFDHPVKMTRADVELESVKRVEGKARLPGEVAGPAVAIGLRITNSGTTPIDLGGVTVNVRDGAGQMSAPLTSAPSAPLKGVLQPGKSATGVYLFELGASGAKPITIEVTPTVDSPIAAFVGHVS